MAIQTALNHWRQQHSAKQTAMSRRGFLSCTAIGATAALLPSHSALALTRDTFTIPGTIAERAGVLPWSLLQKTNFNNFTAPATIPAALAALNNSIVSIEGYIMPFEDVAQSQNFLLTALPAHCPYCLPGGMAGLVTVNTTSPIDTTGGKTVTLTGTLSIDAAQPEGFVFTLQNATPA